MRVTFTPALPKLALSRSAVAAAVLAASLTSGAATPAAASPSPAHRAVTAAPYAPVTAARVAVHFDLDKYQMPENVTPAPGGGFYVTLAKAAQVAYLSPGGHLRILATLPRPADGGAGTPVLNFALTSGIVRDDDGTLYFLYATGGADLTGVWRMRPGGTPRRIAALPANGLPNGLALDARTHTLYATDSALGTIWRVPAGGGTATAWSAAPELAATTFLGANGLKIHNGSVWVSNTDKGTLLSIPIRRDGGAGRVRTAVSGLDGIDDFTFTGHGDRLLAALVLPNQVALVQPDGSRTIVLDAGDGLQSPTSIALRDGRAYVFSAAYQTNKDPNLVVARFHP